MTDSIWVVRNDKGDLQFYSSRPVRDGDTWFDEDGKISPHLGEPFDMLGIEPNVPVELKKAKT